MNTENKYPSTKKALSAIFNKWVDDDTAEILALAVNIDETRQSVEVIEKNRLQKSNELNTKLSKLV